jgi:hypothetical protein
MTDIKGRIRVRRFQRRMNRFTDRYCVDIHPLMVDGDAGWATHRRTRLCKFWLGYEHREINAALGDVFWHRLRRPKSPRYASRAQITTGMSRRSQQRRKARQNRRAGRRTTGVGTFDGKPCANWLIPYLTWAREKGWRGGLNSGYRSPAYSQHLCYQICGRPTCAGRCAGTTSNHTNSTKPSGRSTSPTTRRSGD